MPNLIPYPPSHQEHIHMMSPQKGTILITGAAGFIGQRLTTALLDRYPEYRIVTTDIITPPVPAGLLPDSSSVVPIQADISIPASLSSLIEAAQPLTAVYVLHGIMSSGSEADPDLSLKVNLDATRALLLKLADTNKGVRVIYASSQAVYGVPFPDVITDAVTPTPSGVYGTRTYPKMHSERLWQNLSMHLSLFARAC